ncbi:MAG TPA: ankyrin repeat domain-containing protein, partial [Gemmataceae bacterium]|nr:ankyrin repeat domain-containing protein [Gemmataceae bacterium]
RVEAMIEQKKELNSQEGEDGMTPLCLAAEKGYARVAQTLLKHGADVKARSKSGFAPLDIAASSCQVDLADVLLLAGADPNARHPEFQVTPLHAAAARGCREIVVMLLNHKADVNARDKGGRTPMHYACSKNEVEAAEALLSDGARINEADNEGNSPLHLAAGGYVKILGHPQTKEAGGVKTTTYTQVHLECEGVVKLLLKNGAEVNVKNKADRTPLAVAEHPTDQLGPLQPNALTAELLKKHGAK